MKLKISILVIILMITAVSLLFFTNPIASNKENQNLKDAYVGVAFCGNTTAEAQLLIDRVKSYTNVFVVQSGPVSWNETATNEICDYATEAGLDIVVYFGDLNPRILEANGTTWRTNWVNTAKQRWGEKFLGLYYYDEWGGCWTDTDWGNFTWRSNQNATYDSVADTFTRNIQRELNYVPSRDQFQLFVSDYALYWYVYKGGYDVVLTQIGWNHTTNQDIALTRGAATAYGKDWGIIITWKYNQPPYLDTGENIYQQMATAYQAGAKYIILFNYPALEGNNYGIMQNEHFQAIQDFWKNTTEGKLKFNTTKAQAAMVLPTNYGWAMRRPDDRIWGFWGADEKSPQIWNTTQTLLARYGPALDIIYDDPNQPATGKYTQIYQWNTTITD
ncbi:MAG TPA: hypothetical protein V6C97_01955 [Oculatellaceae cyanobacterium]